MPAVLLANHGVLVFHRSAHLAVLVGGVVEALTSEMDVATVHLMTSDGMDPHQVLDQARSVLEDRCHIAHTTLQVEPDTHQGCSEMSW